MKNPHLVLGIDENASVEEAKSGYRKLALKYHPDVTKYEKNFASEKFIEADTAYKEFVVNKLSPKREESQYTTNKEPSSQRRGVSSPSWTGMSREEAEKYAEETQGEIVIDIVGNFMRVAMSFFDPGGRMGDSFVKTLNSISRKQPEQPPDNVKNRYNSSDTVDDLNRKARGNNQPPEHMKRRVRRK